MIDREYFFNAVRGSLFGGSLKQSQVDGMNYLIDIWEDHFDKQAGDNATMWLAYALATVFHETAQTMRPIEEYGQGSGKSYGQPTGPYDQCYYGRGHVQLTWEDNYKKGEDVLKSRYGLDDVPLHQYPHRMLEDETSALVLFDGMIYGWFTGVGLPKYFDAAKGTEDAYNARKIVNALDKAATIEGYYQKMKAALVDTDEDQDDAA
jgi:putative chitinase